MDAIFANDFSILKHVVPVIHSQGTSTEKTFQSLDITSDSDLSKLVNTKPVEMLSFILSALFTLDPGTQQQIIAHAVSRGTAFNVLAAVNSLGHIVGRSITRILSRPFNKPAARFALQSVRNVVVQRFFDVVVLQILNALFPLRLSLFAKLPAVPADVTHQQSITGRMQIDSDIDSVKTFFALQKHFVEMQTNFIIFRQHSADRTVRQCGHHTHSMQPFHIILLVNHGNLLDAFRAAQKPSEMSDKETFQCCQCGQSCEKLRLEQFETLPNTLLVQLNPIHTTSSDLLVSSFTLEHSKSGITARSSTALHED
ncbi:hypothetical protein BLNAU_23890 [Blattamonas nauphoetae]|uniref:Uncharacterized protein n=1 Tax=Blattamonas nauphoetae TaxID=2049346 RepID=A0ABQ9WPD6_9EUKA|nr:hypothetical protein BLNAU_23890 [Blattamonas nauphoetae]